MRTPVRAIVITLALAALAVACTLEVDGAVGKTCRTANDCPQELVCVAAGRGGTTCEALALPAKVPFDEEDAGTAYYCGEVKPLLDTWCVSCHGVPPAGGAPPTFRADVYESDGGIPGAMAFAESIYFRSVVTKDMPPGLPLPPEEQRILTAWYRSGAPLCDAGVGDAGVADGGSDGG